MVATKVNSFIASLDPTDENRDLGGFLSEAANALRLKSDAELARVMDVSPATLASWKHRGKIPSDQVRWFQSIFPIMVFDRWRNSIPPYSIESVETALSAIYTYYGSRLSDDIGVKDASIVFGPLVAFMPLIAHTHFDIVKDDTIEMPRSTLLKILDDALHWRASRGI